MTTTVLVLGLIAATVLLIGGCYNYALSSVTVSVEEKEIHEAARLALIVANFLVVAAVLAKAAFKTSSALLAISLPMLIVSILKDTYTLFVVAYYLALILTGVCLILIFLEWRRRRRGEKTPMQRL